MVNKKINLTRKNIKRLFAILGMIFISVSMYAQNESEIEKRTQKLQWKEDPNVLEYKIEIQNLAGEVLISEITNKNEIEFSFIPGEYKYKLIAYDMLGRESVTTDWISFEILSVAEEAERQRLAELKRLEEERLEKERLAREEAEKKRQEEERIAREEEEKRRLEEERLALEKAEQERQAFEEIKKIVEEHPLTKAKDIEVKSKDENRFLKKDGALNSVYFLEDPNKEATDAPEEEEAASDLPKQKVDSRDRKFSLSLGGGLPIIVYENDYFSKYFGYGVSGAVNLKIDSFPLSRPKWALGFEVQGFYSPFKTLNTNYYSFSLNLINLQSDLVFRQKLGKSAFWWQLKAGAGLSMLQTNLASSYKTLNRSGFDDRFFVYPKVDAGLSILLIPGTVVFIELGAEYWNIFIPNLNTGVVFPFAALGFRL